MNDASSEARKRIACAISLRIGAALNQLGAGPLRMNVGRGAIEPHRAGLSFRRSGSTPRRDRHR